jgi:hypothetical protein
LSDTPNPVEIGFLWNEARRAELKSQEAFYRMAVSKLSLEGQAKFTELYESSLDSEQPVQELDFGGLAADIPEIVLDLFSKSVTKLDQPKLKIPPELRGKIFFKGQQQGKE